ncbi:hypothetical protein Tco_1400159 [Tanacetum coccineum]
MKKTLSRFLPLEAHAQKLLSTTNPYKFFSTTYKATHNISNTYKDGMKGLVNPKQGIRAQNHSRRRRFKKKPVRKIVEKRVAKAIEEYEKTRSESNNAGGSGSANIEATVAPEMHGCSYKTFTNGKPHSFSGTEGVAD